MADFGADPALVASQSSQSSLSRPFGFDPGEGAIWRGYTWEPEGSSPLANEAFAWADSTGVGRGSGAYGYFVRAYIAGARREPPLAQRILMVLGGERDSMPPADVAAVQRFIARIEAGTDETLQAAQPEGREPEKLQTKLQTQSPSTPDNKDKQDG